MNSEILFENPGLQRTVARCEGRKQKELLKVTIKISVCKEPFIYSYKISQLIGSSYSVWSISFNNSANYLWKRMPTPEGFQ